MIYTRLPLKNTFNTRDLGGYPLEEGTTKWKTILRSDDLSHLDKGDIKQLHHYGVRTIIDLRSEGELEQLAYPDVSPISYVHIPLVQQLNPKDFNVDPQSPVLKQFELKDFYTQCIDSCKEEVKQVLETIAESEGGVLFHCTAGKDRTGIISALLLGLVGASRSDIIANYQTTHTYIRVNPRFQIKRETGLEKMLHSTPESIEHMLKHIEEKYVTIEDYLLEINISPKHLKVIKEKMVESKSLLDSDKIETIQIQTNVATEEVAADL